ncbi:MAG: glycine zipper 2TM domain-containing protein [Phormidesmis sp.]
MSAYQPQEKTNVSSDNDLTSDRPLAKKHSPLGAGLGAAGGGAVGALLGRLVAGKGGEVLGAIAGAVAGGYIGDTSTEDLIALEHHVAEILGEAPGEFKMPKHYSRDELQRLSRSIS